MSTVGRNEPLEMNDRDVQQLLNQKHLQIQYQSGPKHWALYGDERNRSLFAQQKCLSPS
jgi:hypothetical protein